MTVGGTRFSFSSSQKLTRRPEYLACYNRGQRYFTKHFILFALPRQNDGLGPRLGTAVSKKVGKAVRRNRIKRLIRECFRKNRQAVPGDIDLVVVPKKKIPAKRLSYQQVEDDIVPMLRKISGEHTAVSDLR